MKTICKKIPLKEIATFLNGYAFKPNDWSKEGLPIIRIQNLTGTNKEFNYYNGKYNEKYIIENGDILISWSASLGIFLWENMRGILNQHIFKVIFDKNIEIDKTYFLHCMKYLIKKMEKNIHGSTMKHITRPEFEKINFPIYEIDIQRKISKNLIFIAKIIENNKKLLDELVELCKSLFTTMFGDIKTNDKNWEIRKIEDCILNNVKNIDLKTNGEITYIDISSINNKENIISSYKKYDNIREAPSRAKKILNENDILISTVRPALKNIAIFNKKNSGLSIGSTGFCVLRPKDTIDSKYIFEIIKSNNFTETLIKKQIGANYPAVSDRDIKSIKIPVPPIELQNKFAERIEKIEKLKFEIEKSIEVAQNLYDSLISKYFDN